MEPVPVRCRIPDLLIRIGKDQKWLSIVTEVSEPRISEICNLRFYNISIKRAVLFAYHLRCSVDDLFEWEWR
uniref:helix-turn-helix domain-containing protein n=1 Tax=Paenibacillus sp. FSL M7-0896 TaxID=2921610 RepID=UPI00403E914C